jgi:hypothetical protein
MSVQPQAKGRALEAFLARLYTDAALLREFLAAPETVALEAGLDEQAAGSLATMDMQGLQLAAASFEAKRIGHGRKTATGTKRRGGFSGLLKMGAITKG